MASDTKKAAPAAAAKLTYKLERPFEYNGETVTEIDYRRPTGRDMRAWMNGKSGAGDDMLILMTNLAEQPDKFFDAMDGSDFMGFADALGDFLPKPRQTSTR